METASATYTDWQWKQRDCQCPIHRYHVAHLCACGSVISHSQSDWDRHRNHNMIEFDPRNYNHQEPSFYDTFSYLEGLGILPVFDDCYRAVYDKMCRGEEES